MSQVYQHFFVDFVIQLDLYQSLYRKLILKFFDEDVSNLMVRRNCCDNCNKILHEQDEDMKDHKSEIKIKIEKFDEDEDSKKGIEIKEAKVDGIEGCKKEIKIKEEKLDADNDCNKENMVITIKKEPNDSGDDHPYYTRSKRQKFN